MPDGRVMAAGAITLATLAIGCSRDFADTGLSFRSCNLHSDCPEGERCGRAAVCTVECREDRDCDDIDRGATCIAGYCARAWEPRTFEPRATPTPSTTPSPTGGATPTAAFTDTPAPTMPARTFAIVAAEVEHPAGAAPAVRLHEPVSVHVEVTDPEGAVTLVASGGTVPGTSRQMAVDRVVWTPETPPLWFEEQEVELTVTARDGAGHEATSGVRVTLLGNLLVLDEYTGAIVSYGSDGTLLGELFPRGRYGNAHALVRLPGERRLAVTYRTGEVRMIDDTGAEVGSWDLTRTRIDAPGEIAVMGDDSVVVADLETGFLAFFTKSGDFVRNLEARPEERPWARAILPLRRGPHAGDFLVVWAQGGDVDRVGPDGALRGNVIATASFPGAIAELPDGDLVVFNNGAGDPGGFRYSPEGARRAARWAEVPHDGGYHQAVWVGDWLVVSAFNLGILTRFAATGGAAADFLSGPYDARAVGYRGLVYLE